VLFGGRRRPRRLRVLRTELRPIAPVATVPRTDRAAAGILVVIGLGFGLATPIVIAHLRRTGELPMTPWGFRAMSGPFERFDQNVFSALLIAFGAVCAADVAAGALLWRGDPRGRPLAAVATPPGVILGLGFALPFYLAAVPAWSALLVLGRRL
jgi:hypothetical protein